MTAARQVLVRLTDAQHDRLDALALTWGCTAQAALRRLLDEATTATAADVVTLLRAVLAQGGVSIPDPCPDSPPTRAGPGCDPRGEG